MIWSCRPCTLASHSNYIEKNPNLQRGVRGGKHGIRQKRDKSRHEHASRTQWPLARPMRASLARSTRRWQFLSCVPFARRAMALRSRGVAKANWQQFGCQAMRL